MALAEIKTALKTDWYYNQVSKIIEIDDVLYYSDGNNQYYVTGYDLYNINKNGTIWDSFSYIVELDLCKVVTNLNKNKRLLINEKYKYINKIDLRILSKNEERKLKLKRLVNGKSCR